MTKRLKQGVYKLGMRTTTKLLNFGMNLFSNTNKEDDERDDSDSDQALESQKADG